MRKLVGIIIYITICSLCFTLGLSIKRNCSYPIVPIDSCLVDSFTIKDFVLELHLQGIKHSDWVLRQACLESGYFTSTVWKECNNPFGFYYKGEYLQFNDYKSAIAYYKTWQNKWYSGGDYLEFLDKIGYATDLEYEKKLKRINLNNLK